MSLEIKVKETERAKEAGRKADYRFIESKAPEDGEAKAERKTLLAL
jgi:hypothetical protein